MHVHILNIESMRPITIFSGNLRGRRPPSTPFGATGQSVTTEMKNLMSTINRKRDHHHTPVCMRKLNKYDIAFIFQYVLFAVCTMHLNYYEILQFL